MDKHFVSPIFENIWKDRYQKNQETYDENLHRVANFCGKTDSECSEFYQVMKDEYFFPAGRTMSNSGIGSALTLNNCFVAPQIKDDLSAIFETVKLGALTHQRGGGIGYDFSLLRPKGTPTSNDAIASGPVSFANVFNAQTATILQGNRRGANMGVLNVYHPDIEDFLTAKANDKKALEHFNLSIMVDDAFMEAVANKQLIYLHWPVYDSKGRIEINPKNWKISRTVEASELWDKIMKYAYDNGEPGIFFYDNMNKNNNLWYTESIVCSNPCSEYLSGTVFGQEESSANYGGSCNLGSLMLHKFVKNPFQSNAYVDCEELRRVIMIAIKFLDNIIDINTYPNIIYQNYQRKFRTIGLGYTGLADMLAMMGLSYNSPQAREFVDDLCGMIALAAYRASIELAKQKGPFPGLDKHEFVQSGFLTKHAKSQEWKDIIHDINIYGIRNAKLLSVAPTGTMSLVFGNNCSSGIEPIFSLSYKRDIRVGGQEEKDKQTFQIRDYAYNLYCDMFENTTTDKLNRLFPTALNIDVNDHISMLAVIAKHVDMSVSKTINVPTDYPFEKCKDIYSTCWKSGIKGCTIFRPNELRQGIMQTDTPKVEDIRGEIVHCDDSLFGIKRKLMTGCGSMHLMAWYNSEGKIMEVFTGRGSSGGCEKNLTAMARLISLNLRGGVPLEKVLDQLESCGGCSAYSTRRATKKDTSPGSSCATAIAIALKDMQAEINDRLSKPMINPKAQSIKEKLIEGRKRERAKQTKEKGAASCPECGSPLEFEGGCNICKACGWSKCG